MGSGSIFTILILGSDRAVPGDLIYSRDTRLASQRVNSLAFICLDRSNLISLPLLHPSRNPDVCLPHLRPASLLSVLGLSLSLKL
jgi:hypothetical protein